MYEAAGVPAAKKKTHGRWYATGVAQWTVWSARPEGHRTGATPVYVHAELCGRRPVRQRFA